jgi:hypothetical protein
MNGNRHDSLRTRRTNLAVNSHNTQVLGVKLTPCSVAGVASSCEFWKFSTGSVREGSGGVSAISKQSLTPNTFDRTRSRECLSQ